MHIGQAVVAALEAERQAFVVEAEQVHDRGLQIVDVDFVLHRRRSRVRRSGRSSMPAFTPPPASHMREAIGIVIAAENLAVGGAAFAERRAAEFAAADDQRVVEQAALL